MNGRSIRARVLLSGLVVIGVTGVVTPPLAAAEGQARAKARKPPAMAVQRPEPRSAPVQPYVELNSERMKVGSGAWWEQMRREGRLGGETP